MNATSVKARLRNFAEKSGKTFQEVLLYYGIVADDAIRDDLESISVKNIAEFKEYLGLNVSVFAYLDRTQIPVSIDVGFGDIVYPERIEMEFPVLLDMEAPRVYAYSVESVIAEKLEAIVSNGMMNSRYKDFYDIFVLSKRC